jgi:hypothetical protein
MRNCINTCTSATQTLPFSSQICVLWPLMVKNESLIHFVCGLICLAEHRGQTCHTQRMEPSFNHVCLMFHGALQFWHILKIRFHWQRCPAAFRMVICLGERHICKKTRFRKCVLSLYKTLREKPHVLHLGHSCFLHQYLHLQYTG